MQEEYLSTTSRMMMLMLKMMCGRNAARGDGGTASADNSTCATIPENLRDVALLF